MQIKTIGSAVLLGLSGAALAQVAGAPVEQKTGNMTGGNQADSATAPDNGADAPVATATNTVDRAKR